MNVSLNTTKMGVKSNMVCFPAVSLQRIPEYIMQTPSEDPAHKLFKLHTMFLRKINAIGLYSDPSLKPQETALGHS